MWFLLNICPVFWFLFMCDGTIHMWIGSSDCFKCAYFFCSISVTKLLDFILALYSFSFLFFSAKTRASFWLNKQLVCCKIAFLRISNIKTSLQTVQLLSLTIIPDGGRHSVEGVLIPPLKLSWASLSVKCQFSAMPNQLCFLSADLQSSISDKAK